MFAFNHVNFNVLDLDRSLKFYRAALDLEPVRTKDAADGAFRGTCCARKSKSGIEVRNRLKYGIYLRRCSF